LIYSDKRIEHDVLTHSGATRDPKWDLVMRASTSLLVATVFGFGLIMYGANHRKHGVQNNMTEAKTHGRNKDRDCKTHKTVE